MNKTLVRICLWMTIVALGLALYHSPAESNILDLRELTLTYRSFFAGGSDPLITQNPYQPDKALGKELNLTINTDVFVWLYWNSTIHSMTDRNALGASGQFRMVGLETALGIDLWRVLKVPMTFGYYHYSRHLLDTEWGLGHFPVEDALELKIYLYRRP